MLLFFLRTIVFVIYLCYNYLSCIGSRILVELMPGHADQWRLSSFRQAPFPLCQSQLPAYIFLLQIML